MPKEKTHYFDVEEVANEIESKVLVPKSFGICSDCKQFEYQRSKFGKEYFRCNIEGNRFFPSQIDPIEKCSCFTKRGLMDLFDMWNIATMVELKNPVGFKPIDEEEGE